MNNKGKRAVSLVLSLAAFFALGHRQSGAINRGVDAHGERVAEVSLISVAALAEESCDAVSIRGKEGEEVVIGSRLLELFGVGEDESAAAEKGRKCLLVGGGVFGTRIKEARISISSADEGSPLREGDKLISINGRDVRTISDVKAALGSSGGEPMRVVVTRGGKSVTLSVMPKPLGNEYRLGAVLREGAAGIGTVTYIDPETGEFGGLGHGICDPEDGKVIEMTGGTVTDVILGGVVKGESGKPGELSGILTDRPMGEIYANTECGVFGKLERTPKGCGTAMPIAHRSEVHSGEAKIISTLKNGATMEYKVQLSEVKHGAVGTKCFRIRVTDPALLAISGGIVRGMSGSPIIQDGKLVGAVTHVMVANPTEGYGIFIENMLNAARSEAIPKAA